MIWLTVHYAAGRLPVIAGTGSNATSEAIRLSRHAQANGADACLLVNPYYNKPTQKGLYLHFKAVADSVDIPCILYNIKGRTGVNLETDTLVKLANDCPNIVAVQDPAYPVYVDSNVVGGRSGEWAGTSYRRFVYLESTAGNGFIPVPPDGHVDVVYLCFPNNPTGAMATKGQLRAFVDYCIREKAVLVYDASYCEYITESGYPHSIYEVEGATGCAIEINSFSKFAGFTGVRLGWTIVPKAIDIGGPGLLNKLWNRRQCTFFNGASNISQAGGLAALSGEGWRQCRELVGYYLENARVIRKGLASIGLTCHGGVNSPYVWVRAPLDMTRWDFFDLLLEKAHVVVTPGSGFGPAGEHYVRVSAYGHREDVVEAVGSIERNIRI